MPKTAIILGTDWSSLLLARRLIRQNGMRPVLLELAAPLTRNRVWRWFRRSKHFLLDRYVQAIGATVHHGQFVYDIFIVRNEICSIHFIDSRTGEMLLLAADFVFSAPGACTYENARPDAMKKLGGEYRNLRRVAAGKSAQVG